MSESSGGFRKYAKDDSGNHLHCNGKYCWHYCIVEEKRTKGNPPEHSSNSFNKNMYIYSERTNTLKTLIAGSELFRLPRDIGYIQILFLTSILIACSVHVHC